MNEMDDSIAPAALHTQPQPTMEQIMAEIIRLRDVVAEQQQVIVTLRAAQPQPVAPPTPQAPPAAPAVPGVFGLGSSELKAIKISEPQHFDGTRSKLRAFLMQVGTHFNANPRMYATDGQKVAFISSYLTGTAQSWFLPLYEKNSPLLNDYEAFVAKMRSAFSETDEIRKAENQLRKLRQQGSVTTYASDFEVLASKTNWNDEAKAASFRMGLKDDVKDLLITMPAPKDFEELVSFASICDERLYERRMERKERFDTSQPSTTTFGFRNPQRVSHVGSPSTPASQSSGPAPMELGSTRIRHVSPEERQRRMEGNLCLYCGKPDHVIAKCPSKPPTPLGKGPASGTHKLNHTTTEKPATATPSGSSQSGNSKVPPQDRA